MHRFALTAFVFMMSGMAAVAQTPPPPSNAPDPDHKALPAGDGRDTMIRVCSKCHDPDIAAQQDLDGPGWKDLVNQMAGNGASASDAEFDQIVAYLTRAFPPKH
jgi:competence protein ComEA